MNLDLIYPLFGLILITFSIKLLSKTIDRPSYLVGIVGGFFIFFLGMILLVIQFLRL